MSNYTFTRQFGLELEFKGDAYAANSRMNAAGVRSNCENYNHQVRNYWKFVYDASVAYDLSVGGEAVSPILRGEDGIQEARKAADAISNDGNGCKVDRQCGLHAHFDVSDFNLGQFKNLAKLWLKFEDVMEQTVSKSRRGSSTYCKSNMNAFRTPSEYHEFRDASDERKAELDVAACERAYVKIDACNSIEEIANLFGDRYVKLNFQAFFRHRTVEFRLHQGTLNAEKIENWLRLCNYFIMSAKNIRGGVRIRKANGKHGIKRMRDFLYGGKDAELCKYYIKRAKVLNSN